MELEELVSDGFRLLKKNIHLLCSATFPAPLGGIELKATQFVGRCWILATSSWLIRQKLLQC